MGDPHLSDTGGCDSGAFSSIWPSAWRDEALTAGFAPSYGEGPEVASFRRRIKNQARRPMMAIAAMTPITIPAMAPPDSDESLPSSGDGVVAGSAVESGGVVPEVVKVVVVVFDEEVVDGAVVSVEEEDVVLMIDGSSA